MEDSSYIYSKFAPPKLRVRSHRNKIESEKNPICVIHPPCLLLLPRDKDTRYMASLPAFYTPVLPPFAHQRTALERSYAKRVFALFIEQGLGKTKIIYDNCALLFKRGHIDALLVFAPNDVHAQWVNEQMPLHWPAALGAPRAAVWDAGRRSAEKQCEGLLTKVNNGGRFVVLAMNYDALATKRGRKLAERFLKTYRCLLCADESHFIKTPSASRTRAALALAPLAPVRRIATGTPKTQSPFDFFAQMSFLDERILGFDSFLSFKHYYGVFTKEFTWRKDARTGAQVRVPYEQLQQYRRVEHLNAMMAPYVQRTRKADCIDLPPKLPVTRYVELTANQQRAYTQLRDEGLLLLRQAERKEAAAAEVLRFLQLPELEDEELQERLLDSKGRVTLKIQLVLTLRLHQIVGGFVTDDARVTHELDPPAANARLLAVAEAVQEALDSNEGKCIVWAAYRAELRLLEQHLHSSCAPAVRVDGSVTGKRREEAIAAFKDANSATRILVAHPRTMGTGQNLTMATSAWYYSNAQSYVLRAQSEDRIHRLGMRGAVTVGDFVVRAAAPCVDTLILQRLQQHASVAEFFMGANNMTASQLEKLI